MHTYIHTFMHMHMHVCVYMYVYIYIYIYATHIVQCSLRAFTVAGQPRAGATTREPETARHQPPITYYHIFALLLSVILI